MRDLLPASIGDRPKQPYRAPDSQSFVGPAASDYVAAELSPAAIGAAGVFNIKAVDKLQHKCRNRSFVGVRDNMAFVGILSTQLWHRAFARGGEVATAARPSAVA